MKHVSTFMRSTLCFAALVIALAGIKVATPIVVPFLLALFIAIICNPAVNFLERYRIPRGLGIVFIILFIFVMFIGLGGIIGSSVNEFRQALPLYQVQLTTQLNWVVSWMRGHHLQISKVEIESYFDPAKMMSLVTTALSGFSSMLGNIFLLLLTVIFMLFEGQGFSKKLHIAFDDPIGKEKRMQRFLNMVNRYMAIKTLISLATGLIIGFFLWILHVDFFVLWAVLAFLLNYIPNIGSILAAIPTVILTFLQLGLGSASIVLGLFVAVNMLMGNVIEPKYMGRSLGLSTLVVFLSLIFWGWLLGMVGMLLSVPLTMICKIALENSKEGAWFAILLSSDEEIDELIKEEKSTCHNDTIRKN